MRVTCINDTRDQSLSSAKTKDDKLGGNCGKGILISCGMLPWWYNTGRGAKPQWLGCVHLIGKVQDEEEEQVGEEEEMND